MAQVTAMTTRLGCLFKGQVLFFLRSHTFLYKVLFTLYIYPFLILTSPSQRMSAPSMFGKKGSAHQVSESEVLDPKNLASDGLHTHAFVFSCLVSIENEFTVR